MTEETMRAAFIQKASPNAKIEIQHLPKPTVGPDQVLIECHYGSLNWGDTEICHGVYPGQHTEVPYIPMENIVPGAEVSGRIAALGDGVKMLEVGQVVTAISPHITGAFAEYMLTTPNLVTPLPVKEPSAEAACFKGVGFTAYHLLFSAYELKSGNTVLVHSISGGVGLAVTQLASEIGATVLGTTSSAEKAALAMANGATKVFVRGENDLVDGIMEATNGHGIDLMIDSLGGETLLDSIKGMAILGHIINIGSTGRTGYPGSFEKFHDLLYLRCASYHAFDVFTSAPSDSARWKAGVDYLVERFADGRFKLPVAKVFPLDQCEEMCNTMRSGSVSGKLCLAIR